MGTAKPKHNSKPRIKKRLLIRKIDHHEIQTLPGRRILSDEFSKWEVDGNHICGRVREICEYRKEIIGLCSLREFKGCDHREYILQRYDEECPRQYKFYQRKIRK